MSEVIVRPETAKQSNTQVAPMRRPTPPKHLMGSAPPEPAQSPTLIALTLRPNGEHFTGNRIVCAQEAGFDWLTNVRAIGWACPDTGREIARHVVDGYSEATGELSEIGVHIDPHGCAWLWRAGTRLMEMVAKYSERIGGHLCDAAGRPLGDTERRAISDHIDAVMELRRDAEAVARTYTEPSGEVREYSELSFYYAVTREAGSRKQSYQRVFFDAQPMDYYSGRAQGMRMAREVVDFFRAHKTAKLPLTEIIRQALERCENHHGNMQKAEVANVVSGFMEVIETLIAVGSRQLNPAWLTAQINRNEELQVTWSEREAKRKAALAARLRAGREAAKARRLAQGKAGAA